MPFTLVPKNGRTAKDVIGVEFDDNDEVSLLHNFIYEHIASKDVEAHVPFEALRPAEQKIVESMNDYPENCRNIVKVINANELRLLIQNAKIYFGNEGNYNWIDVSNVTSLTCLFKGMNQFNGDITNWDVSNVVNMNDTFKGCSSFDQDLSGWDLSKVRFASNCFSGSGLARDEEAKRMLLDKLTTLPANYKKKSSIFYIF